MTDSENEFRAFYETEYQRVYAKAFSLSRNAQDAEDATQEAFAKALMRWRRLEGKSWRAGWVISTAINTLRKNWHKERRAITRPVSLYQEPQEQDSGSRDILDSLKALPRRQMQAVYLHCVVDLSIREVADVMDISEGAVKSHVNRGRAALRAASSKRRRK